MRSGREGFQGEPWYKRHYFHEGLGLNFLKGELQMQKFVGWSQGCVP